MSFKKWILLSSIAILGAHAQAGSVSGGGGKGVVCRATNGKIKSVELLDLWEARVIFRRQIPASVKSVESQIHQALEQLRYTTVSSDRAVSFDEHGSMDFLKVLSFTADNFLRTGLTQVHWMHGVRLSDSADSFENVTPSACTIEQIVRYDDTVTGGEIYINQDLYDRLNRTNQAALIVHESLYAALRERGDRSSLRTRRAVGLAFAGAHFEPLSHFIDSDVYYCSDDRNAIVFYESRSGFGLNNIVATILKVENRPAVEFESPTSGFEVGGFENFFQKDFGSFANLGSQTGFDFRLKWEVLPGNQKPIRLQLLSAPDQNDTAGPVDLPCQAMTKEQFLNR